MSEAEYIQKTCWLGRVHKIQNVGFEGIVEII